MKQAKLLQIEQAASPRADLQVDRSVETAVLAAKATVCPNQRHIGDDVHHLPIHAGGFGGKLVVQWAPGGGETAHGEYQQTRKQSQ
jgi:hypothetical protein